ncbi:peptidyl-prolyl cis-trans isomerase [Ottowia sp. GY511]|uniref:Periplasmic chaperone PpiD n=1 Tax=Ottowia flava TaxID=2675430 RepID=A0ABW4KPH3_9BURK|nr:SurA N-terminal domain-containing protein [Ottowia sp. GY511]TXK26356.1 peptidyl-prolyl cis-trans isomerase [Ottowia sp. GY511]
MFDTVRKHTKLLMGVLFLLIIPSFVLFGIDGYSRMSDASTTVASVNGKSITQTEWDNAHRAEVDRLRANNPQIDLNLLDSPQIKYASLDQLVRERVLAAAAADEHLSVSDARLVSYLQSDPNMASLRRADGTLNMDEYRRALSAQGLTPEAFEASVRQDMARRQVLGGVANSSFSTQAEADVAMNAFLERREIRLTKFATADYAAKLNPTEAELEAFYKDNLGRYQAPESAKIEYLVLGLEPVKKAIEVSEQDLRKYYEQNSATLGQPEERRAAHILIMAPKDAPAAEREKAKSTAQGLLDALRKVPDTFAEVARKSSQDDVSAASGGDLGFFRSDRGTDPAIAKAAFSLAKAGDVSGLVESDFGYHIVRLTEIKASGVPPFEQARAKLEDQYRVQEAQKRFGELAEEFRNGVYEQSDSLKPTADKLKLSIQTADNVTRTPASGAIGALANAKFLGALFSPDALEKKRNTEAMEVGANELASGRVVSHAPAHARPFAEVKAEVRAAYVAQKGAEQALKAGQERLKAWEAKPESATPDLTQVVTVSRDQPEGQPPSLVEAALRADPAKLPKLVGVNLGAEGFVVARVDKVVPRASESKEVAAQNLQRYEQLWALSETVSYYETLKAKYKAKILVPVPASTPQVAATPAATAASQ